MNSILLLSLGFGLDSGSVEIRIRIPIVPTPGGCHVTVDDFLESTYDKIEYSVKVLLTS